MSNTNAPQGFKSIGLTAGAEPNFGLSTGKMLYNSPAMYRGDVMKLVSGRVLAATVTGNTGAATVGIAEQFSWISIAQGRRVWQNYYPSNDSQGNNDVDVWFTNSVGGLFQVQVNASTAAQADIGSFFNFATGTPNTYSQMSGMSLDYSTKNATQGTLPFVLQGIVQPPASDPASAFNQVIVGFATRTPY